ncbi:hypothetical protein [Nocardia sp. CA-120079]
MGTAVHPNNKYLSDNMLEVAVAIDGGKIDVGRRRTAVRYAR